MRRFTPAYTPEFRAEAVQLVRDGGKPLAEIARDLGVSAESLRQWAGPSGGDRPGPAGRAHHASHGEGGDVHRAEPA